LLRPNVVDGELMAKDRRIELRDQRVQKSGDCGHQNERADEDTRIEVQSQQQGPDGGLAGTTARLGGSHVGESFG
jgi:hypothetical protein